jgi:galactitol-specific phosphotransferase system IIB component
MRKDIFNMTMEKLREDFCCVFIASDLEMDDGVMHYETDDKNILSYAKEKRFNTIALYSEEDETGKIITHSATIDANFTNVQSKHEILTKNIIDSSTTLDKLIELLSINEYYFILERNRISKIVTVSDVNRLPVRTYLNTMIDHFEILMMRIIDNRFPNDNWVDFLSDKRLEKIRNNQIDKQKGGYDTTTTLLDNTTLSDKIMVFEKTDLIDILKSDSQKLISSMNKIKKRCSHIEKLRNQLSHACMMITEKRNIEWLNETVSVINTWTDAMYKQFDKNLNI